MKHFDLEKLLYILPYCILAAIVAVCACGGTLKSSAKLDRALQEVTALAGEHAQPGQADESFDESGDDKAEDDGEAEDEDDSPESKAKGLKDGEYTGTGQGYGGPITLKLIVQGGTIKSLNVVSAGGETAAYFSMAKPIISKIIALGSANVDGVSGATYSSNGIKAAAAQALKKAGGDGSVSLKKARPKAKGKSGKGTKKKKYTKPSGGWKDGKYTGSAKGFGGTVSVTVTIRNGKIKSVSASGKNETASYWKRAQAVKGRIVKAQSPKVDAVSGATYSSNGIINAVINALSKAEKKDAKKKGPKDQAISTAKEEYSVTAGGSVSLDAKAKTSLKYKSSKPAVATVSSKGTVTALTGGKTVITITAAKTSKYKKAEKKVTVTVKKKEQSITISGYSAGSSINFDEKDIGKTVSLAGQSESGEALSYSSDAVNTVAVDQSGTVTIKGTGKARITISAPSTGVYESASVVIIINVNKSDAPDDGKINGTFTGEGEGYGGKVTADVEISDSLIKNISVTGEDETHKYWTKAKKIVPKMIERQTWDVDAVSGATLSSNGIRNAVKQALQKAGLI